MKRKLLRAVTAAWSRVCGATNWCGCTGVPRPPTRQRHPEPLTPVVKIQGRVPADSPPDDQIKYVITVQNTSQADAHQVTVRNPIPEGAEAVKADPKWEEKAS